MPLVCLSVGGRGGLVGVFAESRVWIVPVCLFTQTQSCFVLFFFSDVMLVPASPVTPLFLCVYE